MDRASVDLSIMIYCRDQLAMKLQGDLECHLPLKLERGEPVFTAGHVDAARRAELERLLWTVRVLVESLGAGQAIAAQPRWFREMLGRQRVVFLDA